MLQETLEQDIRRRHGAPVLGSGDPFGRAVEVNLPHPYCNCPRVCVLDAQTQNGDEPVGEYSFLGQSCLSSADS